MIASVSIRGSFLDTRSLQGGETKVRDRDAVVAADVEALAAVGDGAGEDRLPRSVVIARVALRGLGASVAVDRDQVEDRGREAANVTALLVCDIAGHRQRLQVDL